MYLQVHIRTAIKIPEVEGAVTSQGQKASSLIPTVSFNYHEEVTQQLICI